MLADADIDLLVCGAISRPLLNMVHSYGISVIPFISGEIGKVIDAFIEGDLERAEFMMPGCHRGRWRKEDPMMQGAGGGGGRGGGGGGRGMGRGGGRGRMGGPAAGGPGGACVCPACGHKQPHQAGVPCNSRQCPECGAAMTREVR